jgi:hypothetical protein
MGFFEIIFLVLGVLGLFGLLIESYDKRQENNFIKTNYKQEEFLKKLLSNFKDKNEFHKANVIDSADGYSLFLEEVNLLPVNVWLSKQSLCFSITEDSIKTLFKDLLLARKKNGNKEDPILQKEILNYVPIKRILLTDIVCYLTEGQLTYAQNVSGGGTSLGGAVVGGILAGGVGAIIGSRKKIESEVEEIDDRKIVLIYKENGKVIKKFFDYIFKNVFDTLIPEKDYQTISLIASKPLKKRQQNPKPKRKKDNF